MYKDDSIELNFHIPKILQEYIDLTEQAVNENDEMLFDSAMEMVEVCAKEAALAGKISYSDMSKIKKKYGGWG